MATDKELHCMVCDVYETFDRHLARDEDVVSEMVADLVHILPPRGHGFHDLTIWQYTYRSQR